MIRLILLIFDFLLLAIATLFTYPLSRLIGCFSKSAQDRFCYKFAQLGMKSFLFYSGAKVEYKGLEYIPEKGSDAVVFIGNHRGFFDVVATYAAIPGITGFIAKKELKTFPLVGWWMSSVYCVFLDRNDKRQGLKAILQGVDNVKNGKNMLVYPEGTRSHTEGVLGPFHPGSFKLATKAGAKIIPVCSNNSSAVFEDIKPRLKAARMCIEFCPPIETKGLTTDELIQLPDKVHSIIQERVIANGKEIGSLPEDFQLEE